MKKLVVAFLVLGIVVMLLVTVLYNQGETQGIGSQIGRYQLFQGRFQPTNLSGQAVAKENTVFLLDTVTGNAFLFEMWLSKKGIRSGWVPCEREFKFKVPLTNKEIKKIGLRPAK